MRIFITPHTAVNLGVTLFMDLPEGDDPESQADLQFKRGIMEKLNFIDEARSTQATGVVPIELTASEVSTIVDSALALPIGFTEGNFTRIDEDDIRFRAGQLRAVLTLQRAFRFAQGEIDPKQVKAVQDAIANPRKGPLA